MINIFVKNSVKKDDIPSMWGSKLVVDGPDKLVKIFNEFVLNRDGREDLTSRYRETFKRQFFSALSDAFANLESNDFWVSFVTVEISNDGTIEASVWPRVSRLWTLDMTLEDGSNYVSKCDGCSNYTCGNNHHKPDCPIIIVSDVLSS